MMMLPTLTAALILLISAQETPADTEAEDLAQLHARTLERCESQPRGENETAEACAQRRATALIGTYGSVAGALGATAGWGPRPEATGASLGFPTIDEVMADQARERRSTAAPARQPYRPPPPRCRRESTRSEDGTSASTTVICGNGGDAERAARDMLDRLREPSN